MTDAPIDFNVRLRAKRAAQGEYSFLLCACQADAGAQEGFFPVVLHDAHGQIVTALVCAGCGSDVQLTAGRPEGA